MLIRLASCAAVAALCFAGTPAIADETPDAQEPSYNTALTEWRGAVRFWAATRGEAERAIAAHPGEALLVDDLTAALAYGDGLSVQPLGSVTATRLHLAAIQIWACISHVLGITIRPAPEV